MPTLTEQAVATIKVAASAPIELMWLLHFLEARHEHEGVFANLEPLRRKYGPQLATLWPDRREQYTGDVTILAERGGTLLDVDMARFFSRAEKAAAAGVVLPSLRSELAADVDTMRARLERLRTDAALRRRYFGLLEAIWSEVDGEWRAEGRPAVLAEGERWVRALEQGQTYKDVVGLPRLWPGRPELDELADAAAAEGRLTLNPCWFGGKVHIEELDGAVHVGRGIRCFEPSDRKLATEVSAGMKALADATRLTILVRLGRRPATVTELARQMHLSQPTVSAHVQVLREAGLLDERPVGRSAELSANEEGLRRLLSRTEDSILRAFRP